VSLSERLAALGVRLATRRIVPGDEAAFPDPSEPLARRRASGAARIAARAALAALGGPADAPLPRSPHRYPLWPRGYVGSLAHDAEIAVAAAARAADLAALGVDVEPAEPLPDDVAEIALVASERCACAADATLARAMFAAKEAVYKAINPLDGSELEYEDIEVDPAAGVARLRDGRALRLEFEPALSGVKPPPPLRVRAGERGGRLLVVALLQPPAMRASRSWASFFSAG
jgi:4'-phosphopantetheinyl transferase EntD